MGRHTQEQHACGEEEEASLFHACRRVVNRWRERDGAEGTGDTVGELDWADVASLREF